MINITYPQCLILEASTGTSKAGQPFAHLKFLEQTTLDVYEFLCFGDSVGLVAGMSKGATLSLTFALRPNNSRESSIGVRAELVEVGR